MEQSISDEISALESLFKSHHVPISRDWLESCINWCKEETLPSSYTLKELQMKVLEQWLILDLRDLEVPCLPPNISQKKKYILNGTYSLQLMYVSDISKPKLWQLQRIRNGIPKNLDREPESAKRVLMLCLTDGVQEVFASEYQPIPCFNINMIPGLKIKVTGPVDVRNGRLLLKKENIKLLGGEVESLIVPNAAENMLAKQLGMPINPKPNVISETLLAADMTNTTQSSYANITSRNVNITGNMNIMQPTMVHNESPKNPNNPLAERVVINPPEHKSDEIESKITDEDMQLLMELEADFEEPPMSTSKLKSKTEVSLIKKKCTTPDMFEDMDLNDADFANIDVPVTFISQENKNDLKKQSFQSGPSKIQSIENKTSKTVRDPTKTNVSYMNSSAEAVKSETTTSLPVKNVWSIEKLLRNIPTINKGKFKVKGKFVTVIEKMVVINDGYHLVINVKDESGELTVKIVDEVIAGVIGYSAVDFMNFKDAILNENTEAESKVLEALKKLKLWITKLDSVMEVQVDKEQTYPLVLKVL